MVLLYLNEMLILVDFVSNKVRMFRFFSLNRFVLL